MIIRILFIIIIAIVSSDGFCYDIREPIVYLYPNPYIVNISAKDDLKLELGTDAKDSNMFLNGIHKVSLKIIDLEDQSVFDKQEFNGFEEIRKYSISLNKVSDFRFIYEIKMRSGYVYDGYFTVAAVDIPGVETLDSIDVKYHPGSSFDVIIPFPRVVYKAVDMVFVIDNSGSMSNEIVATKAASQSIFQKLKEITGDVMGGVVTFSTYGLSGNVYNDGNFTVAVQPNDNPQSFNKIPIKATGGREFQFFALYKTASRQKMWRRGSLKLLVLMTDEADNVYCKKERVCNSCDFEKKILWEDYGPLSAKDIIGYLKKNNICISVLFNEINADECYGVVFEEILKEGYAGSYAIPKSVNSASNIVDNLQKTLFKIISGTKLFLEPIHDDKSLIEKIIPVEPAECIDNTLKGFDYQCAAKKGQSLKFKITLKKKRMKIKKYGFLLSVKTDKESLVSIKPVSISK